MFISLSQNVPAVPEFRQPVFRLSPARMELRPGESMILTVEGMVNDPQEVKERILCHSIIGRQGGKELIMKVDMYVEFICPLLEFSNKAVFFRFDKVRYYYLTFIELIFIFVVIKLPSAPNTHSGQCHPAIQLNAPIEFLYLVPFLRKCLFKRKLASDLVYF